MEVTPYAHVSTSRSVFLVCAGAGDGDAGSGVGGIDVDDGHATAAVGDGDGKEKVKKKARRRVTVIDNVDAHHVDDDGGSQTGTLFPPTPGTALRGKAFMEETVAIMAELLQPSEDIIASPASKATSGRSAWSRPGRKDTHTPTRARYNAGRVMEALMMERFIPLFSTPIPKLNKNSPAMPRRVAMKMIQQVCGSMTFSRATLATQMDYRCVRVGGGGVRVYLVL